MGLTTADSNSRTAICDILIIWWIKAFNMINNEYRMKKTKENREPRRPTHQFFKYVQPGQSSQCHSNSSQQKVHTRSMIELEPNPRYQLSNRQMHPALHQHLNNVSSSYEAAEIYTVKSSSLKKFLSLFAGSGNSNSLLDLKHGASTKPAKQPEG